MSCSLNSVQVLRWLSMFTNRAASQNEPVKKPVSNFQLRGTRHQLMTSMTEGCRTADGLLLENV